MAKKEKLSRSAKSKVPAFPNEYFRSQGEYFAFGEKYGVWGPQAQQLKKELSSRKVNLIPDIKPPIDSDLEL